jgi:hypothetical protein
VKLTDTLPVKSVAAIQCGQAPYSISLTDGSSSRYRIIIPSSATASEQKAADVFQGYILRITGVALPILRDDQPAYPYEIVIGQSKRLSVAKVSVPVNELSEDGFLLATDSARFIIAGGMDKGALYGVYTFLEKYLGCRMYAPDVKIIPVLQTIQLGKIYDLQIPRIRFRDTHYRVTWDQEYTDWHKLDHNAKGERTDWGMWVHTFNALVPPEVYYKDHPEYFSLVKGKRIPTQLCLSNPQVLQLVIAQLRQKIAQNPAAKYWSVSQNDNRDYCTCDECSAVDRREGSPSGSIVQFVNAVADAFPDKTISTLAYEYGRHAPKMLKPRDNVNIMLCSIEAFRHKPLTEDSASADFVEDVQEWGKIAKDIIVWDYVIQFPNLLSPFPNFHVLQPNIRFFVEYGVNALFEQGNREVGGEFAALRAYMLSKFMWDPYLNTDSVMNDFLNGYYGAAARPIRRYIDTMTSALLASGKPLRIFGSPNEASASYLTPSLLKYYVTLFDEALSLVVSDPTLTERVRIARLPVEFAILEQAKKNYTGANGLFEKVNGVWEVRSDIRSMIDPFADWCVREGVTRVKEWSTSPDEYRAATYRLFALGMKEHLAYGKKVQFISPDTASIKRGTESMLTDGVRGGHEYEYSWFSVSGKNLEVVIDLESERSVRRMETAFFQYGFWLRLMPLAVTFYVSNDGRQFTQVGEVVNTLPIDQYGGQQRDFIVSFAPVRARYVKVIAKNMGNTPSWHPGAGRPAIMLVDEIVVE